MLPCSKYNTEKRKLPFDLVGQDPACKNQRSFLMKALQSNGVCVLENIFYFDIKSRHL